MSESNPSELPWLELESFRTGRQLYRVIRRVAGRNRKRFPLTAWRMRAAASRVGGKLARSSVDLGDPERQLQDRAKALRAVACVQLELSRMLANGAARDADVTAGIELAERVRDLIRIGR